MGKRAETRDELRQELVTKTHGPPTDQDITTLERELIALRQAFPLDWEEEIMVMRDLSLMQPNTLQ